MDNFLRKTLIMAFRFLSIIFVWHLKVHNSFIDWFFFEEINPNVSVPTIFDFSPFILRNVQKNLSFEILRNRKFYMKKCEEKHILQLHSFCLSFSRSSVVLWGKGDQLGFQPNKFAKVWLTGTHCTIERQIVLLSFLFM